jgi:hypothetical protein
MSGWQRYLRCIWIPLVIVEAEDLKELSVLWRWRGLTACKVKVWFAIADGIDFFDRLVCNSFEGCCHG